ncbi:MAG: type II toxin-antitoxin system VapC family toxin [Terracidiphilus sp.]|nr:type II toxin-antitoxin system VapC family toxin [Terracidiphilus sp.]
MILLDTNVVSEVMRERPDPTVRAWLRALPRRELWTASIVIAELLSGIDLMPAGRKQQTLREAVEAMIAEDFRGQVLKFDVSAARHYAQILASRKHMGRPMREMDALIAATAKSNDATLATRNLRDFENCGLQLVNPWQ